MPLFKFSVVVWDGFWLLCESLSSLHPMGSRACEKGKRLQGRDDPETSRRCVKNRHEIREENVVGGLGGLGGLGLPLGDRALIRRSPSRTETNKQ